MNTQYSIDYFIEKFTAIPDERWASGSLTNAFGRRCALGHCGMERGHCYETPTAEALALGKILNQFWGDEAEPEAAESVWCLNDGHMHLFALPTNWRHMKPRARILAALQDAKSKAEAALDQYETRPLLPVTKPEPVEVA